VSFEGGAEEDLSLLRQAAGGDDGAFERLVARHQASVHRFVRTLTSDPSAAEDALQETFVAAWRGAGRFRADASVRSWLFTIARRAVQRQFRRPAGAPSAEDVEPLDELGLQAGWGTSDPEADAIRRQRRDSVARALDSLDADDRRVLVLRDLEQLSGEEAADVLGLTLPALKSRLHRARLRFAARLRHQEVIDGI
jgi:RNA polymerase sigma-70 factor, ECF subfamily